MQDDVLDLFGSKGRAELGADLYEGKLSALVVAHIEANPESRQELRDFLDTPREKTRTEDVEQWIERFRSGGALETVCRRIVELSRDVTDHPVLQEFPEVVALRDELIELVLNPIAHVLEGLGLSR